MSQAVSFPTKYGPWALVAGAAVGLGAEYARQIAGEGLSLVLLDRDEAALRTTSREIAAAHGVETRPIPMDLARPDLVDALRPALADLEIGLVVYNAAIGTVSTFLDMEAAHVERMIDVNCRGVLRLVHWLAPPMVRRGRGGVILMSSLSGTVGSAQLAVYAATKAFTLVLGDALWAELGPQGVDVLVVQPGSTRTPGWLASQPADAEPSPVPVMEPPEVVREALAALGVEPCVVPGEMNRQGAQVIASLPRRQAIELMSAVTAKLVPKL